MMTPTFKSLPAKLITLMFVGFLVLTGCENQQPKNHQNEISRYTDYIDAVTTGEVSSDARIILKFSREAERMPDTQLADAWHFSPAIEGSYEVLDSRTIIFQPKEKLPKSTKFTSTVNLKSFFEVPEKLSAFEFSFTTIDSQFEDYQHGISPADEDITLRKAPKLVIGIVVDQMRYDYLYKYWDQYSEGGFKRLLREGAVMHDAHIHYMPTATGPGHASIFTGTGPAIHGIIGNAWFDRESGKNLYCTKDDEVKSVGTSGNAGQQSPRNLRTTTIGDQLRLHSNKESKVISIAIKDRASILSAGHLANAAYWFDDKSGNWITSSFYQSKLPDWVTAFNKQERPAQLVNQKWELFLPRNAYKVSEPDDQKDFEKPFKGEKKVEFPYDLKKLSETNGLEIISSTPFGNTLTFEFAKNAINSEKLGQRNITDMLCLSLSSPDIIGHQFGVHSMEMQDTYLRLDRELRDFLIYLDTKVGLDNVVLFLTADHGAADSPKHIKPAGYSEIGDLYNELKKMLGDKYGNNVIAGAMNNQIYFNYPLPKDLRRSELVEEIRQFYFGKPGIEAVVDLHNMANCPSDPVICERIRNGVNPVKSGDILVLQQSGWLAPKYEKGGTDHFSPFYYDSHVPLIFLGKGLNQSQNYNYVEIRDIAPTLTRILGCNNPSGSTGRAISGIFE